MSRRATPVIPEEADESEEILDPRIAMVRADARSAYYDPRYARPLSSAPPGGWGEIDTAFLDPARSPVPPFPLDLLPPLAVNLVALGKGLERMALDLELLGDTAHHARDIILGLVGAGSDSPRFLSNLAEATQEPGLAHAALPGDVDDEAAAGILGGKAQIGLEEGHLFLPPDEFLLLAAFKDILQACWHRLLYSSPYT